MFARILIVLMGLLTAAQPARAQELVTSAGPAAVSVTVYRAPGRRPDVAIDRSDPQGFALITETRTVTLPAGLATIRFEGVASGILAESAIVAGLPDGAREKNLDADLLSPRTLFDRAIGRRVLIRRTDPTGAIREVLGTIRSSRGGGMVLTTPDGVEAIGCAGVPEQLVYDTVPPGLSAKPTLSIAVDSPVARTVTLILSYLAGGFDWQANYVATMRPDGGSADLVAWLTLVSDDITSFVDAGTQVVAGKLNREHPPGRPYFPAGSKERRCWRVGAVTPRGAIPPPPAPPPPAMMAMPAPVMESAQDIVVTGSRIARQEELGDLKLYRVPQPVTVAAKAQKQVALLVKHAVPVSVVYVSRAFGDDIDAPELTLRARNRAADGLGLPLPAGKVAVFQPAAGRDVLVGETSLDDKAVGEDVKLTLDESNAVAVTLDRLAIKSGARRLTATVTNANPWAIAYEAEFDQDPDVRLSFDGARTFARDGRRVWATTVPANGSATLRYRVARRR